MEWMLPSGDDQSTIDQTGDEKPIIFWCICTSKFIVVVNIKERSEFQRFHLATSRGAGI